MALWTNKEKVCFWRVKISFPKIIRFFQTKTLKSQFCLKKQTFVRKLPQISISRMYGLRKNRLLLGKNKFSWQILNWKLYSASHEFVFAHKFPKKWRQQAYSILVRKNLAKHFLITNENSKRLTHLDWVQNRRWLQR